MFSRFWRLLAIGAGALSALLIAAALFVYERSLGNAASGLWAGPVSLASPMIQLAIGLAAGSLIATIMGWFMPLRALGKTARRSQADLKEQLQSGVSPASAMLAAVTNGLLRRVFGIAEVPLDDAELLASGASKRARTRVPLVANPAPDGADWLRHRLGGWFYESLQLLLIGAGVLLGLIALTQGAVWQQDPALAVERPLLGGLASGLCAAAICGVSAFAVWLVVAASRAAALGALASLTPLVALASGARGAGKGAGEGLGDGALRDLALAGQSLSKLAGDLKAERELQSETIEQMARLARGFQKTLQDVSVEMRQMPASPAVSDGGTQALAGLSQAVAANQASLGQLAQTLQIIFEESGGPAALAQGVSAAAGGQPDIQRLTPQAAKRISAAIRELKKSTDDTLPEL